MADILQRFPTATEWVDLSNLLERLKRAFKDNPRCKTPNKKDLAKRLSQCLTPKLSMIHTLALEIYTEVFKREVVSSLKSSNNLLICFNAIKQVLTTRFLFILQENYYEEHPLS